MRYRHLFSIPIAVFVLTLSACAPSPVPKKDWMPVSPEITTAMEDFEKAEGLFQRQEYSEALAVYRNYLKKYPNGPLADAAWIKIGLLYMAMEEYEESREAFQTLLADYPQSPFTEDTRFNVILTYYKEGDYKSAVRSAESALKFTKSSHQEFRIYYLLGYAYSSSREFEDAVRSLIKAYERTLPQGRKEILASVKEIIPYLKVTELQRLLESYGDRVPGGYLRLELARHYASKDEIDAAIRLLSDFASLFPDHDEIETATAFLGELKAASMVDRFLIGCVLPLTGTYGTFGNRALTGIELALHQFNSRHRKNPIHLLIKDSRGEPDEAARTVESLALTEKVIAIIGPMITSEAAAVEAQARKIPIMTLTQKPDITERGDYVFRNFMTPSLQIKAIVDYAVKDLGLKRFAILYPEEQYGVSFMNGFWDALLDHDAEVVAVESYRPDQTDFGDPVKKLVGLYYPRPEITEERIVAEKEAWILFSAPGDDETEWLNIEQPIEFSYGMMLPQGAEEQAQKGISQGPAALDLEDFLVPQDLRPEESTDTGRDRPEEKRELQPVVDFEAIFIPDSHEKIALIAPQFLYNDVSGVLLLGTNLWHSEKLIETAGSHVQGAVVPDGFFVDSPSEKVQNFVGQYKEVFGTPPGFLEAQAYDAAWVLFQALSHPGVWSRRTVKTALMEILDFEGITGVTSFDERGDAVKPLYLVKIKGNRFVQIRP
jgi:ABC-type branched-subunit amino acid transport system substrate-binding protein/outer membrane protein assembly factor BamD (BamD/ComL family)